MDVRAEAIKEIDAIKALRAGISALTDDEDTIRDTLEGEVDLTGLITRLLHSIKTDEALQEGLTDYIGRLKARSDRYGARIDAKRALIQQAMEISSRRSVETPVATVSLKKTAPKVVITNEADVPGQFWKRPDPVIDKRALLAALKGGDVPGASLSNGGETIDIRTL